MPTVRKQPSPSAATAVSEMPVAQLASAPAPISSLSPIPAGVLPRRPLPPSPDLASVDESELVLAFNRFLGPAQELPDAQVKPLRGDPLQIYRNLVAGAEAVLAHEPGLRATLPEVDWRTLHELPQLALALSFAASQVSKRSRGGHVAPLLAGASKLRRLMLAAADMLVLAGDLAASEVEKIRKGNGHSDLANDCIDLVELFRRHDAARQRTVITPEILHEAQELGEELLGRLPGAKDGAARKAPVGASVRLRDRMWTLLNNRHRELRRIGMWLFMDDVNQHVPNLLARAPGKKPAAAKKKK